MLVLWQAPLQQGSRIWLQSTEIKEANLFQILQI